MSTFQKLIEEQARELAANIILTFRGMSIAELAALTKGQPLRVTKSTSSGGGGGGGGATKAKKAAGKRRGRPSRSSDTEVAKTLDQIVSAVSKAEDGLRAEDIRAKLGIEKRDLVKPIADGLSSGRLEKAGEKRATRYYPGRNASKK